MPLGPEVSIESFWTVLIETVINLYSVKKTNIVNKNCLVGILGEIYM